MNGAALTTTVVVATLQMSFGCDSKFVLGFVAHFNSPLIYVC